MKKFKVGERVTDLYKTKKGVIEDITLHGYYCWVRWDGVGYCSWEPEHHLNKLPNKAEIKREINQKIKEIESLLRKL